MLQSGRTESAVALYEGLRDGSGSAEYSVACAYVGAARYEEALKVLAKLPDTLIAPDDNSPVGQASLLEAAALSGRNNDGDFKAAAEKLRFAVAQNPIYWLPILKASERDPQNDYRIQVKLLEPILDDVLKALD